MSWVPNAGSEEEIPDKLISQEVPQVVGNNCQIDGSLLEIIRLVSYLFRERLKIGLHNVPFLNKPLSITLPVIAKAHEAHYLQHKNRNPQNFQLGILNSMVCIFQITQIVLVLCTFICCS